jgi:hypothetical protein
MAGVQNTEVHDFLDWVIKHKRWLLASLSGREQEQFTEGLGNARLALAAKDAEIARLRELIRKNWQGNFWRGVNHRDAAEIRDALNQGASDA